MKTNINNSESQNFDTLSIKNNSPHNVEISKFDMSPQKPNAELTLQSPLFTRPPHNIRIKDNKLILIIEEMVEINHADNESERTWASYYYHSYVRFHHISFMLPTNELTVQELTVDTKNKILKIILINKME